MSFPMVLKTSWSLLITGISFSIKYKISANELLVVVNCLVSFCEFLPGLSSGQELHKKSLWTQISLSKKMNLLLLLQNELNQLTVEAKKKNFAQVIQVKRETTNIILL